MRWASELICRDLKGLAARCTNRVRSLLSNNPSAPDLTVRTGNEDTPAYALPPQGEVGFDPPIEAEAILGPAALSAVPSFSSGTVSDSNPTLPTEVSHASLEDFVTLHSLLSQKLKDLYDSESTTCHTCSAGCSVVFGLFSIWRRSIVLPTLLMTSSTIALHVLTRLRSCSKSSVRISILPTINC
jgi:hypothetical protein